jgi:YHS domain-containing protein
MPLSPAAARVAALVLALCASAAHDSPAPPAPAARVQPQRDAPRSLEHFNLGKDRLALQGYDPVAYFPVGGGKPRKGLATLVARHRGVTYRFATEAHRALFLADPARYEPQYGGWCAYAMAEADKVSVDPESFLVTDGRLYLFFKSWYADTRSRWRKDEKALATKADSSWKRLLEERPER